ncbi:YoaP domain-containing protein [Clostridium thermobutyricum]|uniref:YoaP domain-containing protein n=1 Tax=Clostridium thermobutyricum TaxID=29372 RepID=UPI002942BBDB|nr:YoaP domain-containing protein [Clostridium thermobutyricum]
MEIIDITKENLESEHICCAIASNQDFQVLSKKEWIFERLDEGLVFKKGNVRGKCFIEYIPAEMAWVPIIAEGYMFINCFLVAGQYKGKGNSNLLLDECIKDSKEKGKKGLVILSSKKKAPYLSDPKFLKYKGFKVVDTAYPYYELLYLPFKKREKKPRFKENAKKSSIKERGFILYYTHQCPFTVKYVPLIENLAKSKNIPFKAIQIKTREEAQNAPSPFTTYSLFFNGRFITNEILSVKKFERIIALYGLLKKDPAV